MKDIKDYIHLYIGCEVFGTYNDNSGSKGILTGVTNGGHECEIQFFLEDGINVEEEPEWNETKEVKLILRPLSSMTVEEAVQYIQGEFGNDSVLNGPEGWENKQEWLCGIILQSRFKQSPEGFRILLSKGFDIFGLIDSNLAIDSSTITKNKQ